MFESDSEKEQDLRVTKYRIRHDDRFISLAEFLRLLADSHKFREFFSALIAGSPYKAFRWETPAASTATSNAPFEFVLINAPSLERAPDRRPFAEHFSNSATHDVLGRNAQLIVPCPTGEDQCYTHLASFLRGAPAEQVHRLWQLVAREMLRSLQRDPRWLSTAGGGVAWLHVRIDTTPKYYGYAPYKRA